MLELKKEKLEAIDGFMAYRKKRKRKQDYKVKKVDTIENEIEASENLRKNKMLIEFNDFQRAALKQIAVKTQTFPDENKIVREIYDEYLIERILVFHILIDTDSTSIQFVAISKIDSIFTEPEFRLILFKIISRTKICERFDKSDEFWETLGVHDFPSQKFLGLNEVESINDPCLITLAVNLKEYFEYFKSANANKKHKGIKKGSLGINYKNYAERIKHLYDFALFKKPKADMKSLIRISAKKGEMTTHKITKTKFSQINDKRFYLPNANLSLPFGHTALKQLDKYKKKMRDRSWRVIL